MRKLIMISSLFAAVLIILGFVAPTEFSIERSVLINKPKDQVFNSLKFLKNHDQWSPWSKRDPNMKKEHKGTDGTVGFISAWDGNNDVGVGEQEIKNIVEGERIETEVRFKKPIKDTNTASLVTESVDAGQTKVTWSMQGKMPFPRNVICLLLNMQEVLKKDFDEGLASLKFSLEK